MSVNWNFFLNKTDCEVSERFSILTVFFESNISGCKVSTSTKFSFSYSLIPFCKSVCKALERFLIESLLVFFGSDVSGWEISASIRFFLSLSLITSCFFLGKSASDCEASWRFFFFYYIL